MRSARAAPRDLIRASCKLHDSKGTPYDARAYHTPVLHVVRFSLSTSLNQFLYPPCSTHAFRVRAAGEPEKLFLHLPTLKTIGFVIREKRVPARSYVNDIRRNHYRCIATIIIVACRFFVSHIWFMPMRVSVVLMQKCGMHVLCPCNILFIIHVLRKVLQRFNISRSCIVMMASLILPTRRFMWQDTEAKCLAFQNHEIHLFIEKRKR